MKLQMTAMKLKHTTIFSNDLRLKKYIVRYDLRNHYFTNRAINIWNGLPKPNCVVCIYISLFEYIFIHLGQHKTQQHTDRHFTIQE